MAMYTVTRNCAKGKIDNCDCGPNPRDDADKREGFTWGRCTEDVKFGLDVTERFIDAAERPNSGGGYDATELMNLHNNEAGRLVSNFRCKKISEISYCQTIGQCLN